MSDNKIVKQKKTSAKPTQAITKKNNEINDIEVVDRTVNMQNHKTTDRNIIGSQIPETFWVVNINGSQEIVWRGLELSVDKINDLDLENDIEVLLYVSAGKVSTDNSAESKIKFEKIEDYLGEKVTTRVFKAKSRYRRTRGKRQHKTLLKVS
ncbi:bL21 family ribosomal protein [bacterium]|nr:MAG: bL21 family ribosomal protein [bacterium]